ncbi:MAG: hypothetical protein ACOCU5_02455 [Bacillota bacterium]
MVVGQDASRPLKEQMDDNLGLLKIDRGHDNMPFFNASVNQHEEVRSENYTCHILHVLLLIFQGACYNDGTSKNE